MEFSSVYREVVAAVGYTGVPRLRGQAKAAIRGNLHVEGKHAYPEIDLALGHLLPVNVEPCDLLTAHFEANACFPSGVMATAEMRFRLAFCQLQLRSRLD